MLQGLLILETHRGSQVLISPPFQHVPQMDMTAVCIWQIKSGKCTCCVCAQPVLEPEPWGCTESRFTKWVKREAATNSCAKLLSVWSQLFSSLTAILEQGRFFPVMKQEKKLILIRREMLHIATLKLCFWFIAAGSWLWIMSLVPHHRFVTGFERETRGWRVAFFLPCN